MYFGFFAKAKLCELTNNSALALTLSLSLFLYPPSLFIRTPLIRHDVSIKLQSKREELKSVLCV